MSPNQALRPVRQVFPPWDWRARGYGSITRQDNRGCPKYRHAILRAVGRRTSMRVQQTSRRQRE